MSNNSENKAIQTTQLKKHDTCFQVLRIYVYVNVVLLYPFVYFHRTCPTIVIEDMAEAYGEKKSKLGIFSTMFFYPYAVLQLFAGLFADIMDPVILIASAQLLSSVGGVICGASKSLAVGCVGRFLVGLGCGVSYVPICKVCSFWFPLKYYSDILGISAIVGNIGGIIASYPLVTFCEKYSWRVAFYGISGLGAVIAILALIFCRGTPTSRGYEPVNPAVVSNVKDLTVKEKFQQLGRNFITVAKSKDFWIMGMYIFFKEGPYFDVSGLWGGPFLIDVHGYTKKQKGLTTLGQTIGSALGGVVFPRIEKPLKTKKWILIVGSILSNVIFLVLIITGDNEKYGFEKKLYPLIYVIYIFIGMTLSGTVCINNSLLREYFDPKIAGTSIGMGNFLCYLATCIYQNVSSAIIPKEGHVPGKESTYLPKGYRNGLWIFCFVSTIGATITAIFCKDTKDHEKKEEQKPAETAKPVENVQQEEIQPEINNGDSPEDDKPGEKEVELQVLDHDKMDSNSKLGLNDSSKRLKLQN